MPVIQDIWHGESETTKAWVAGLLDGEGYLGVRKIASTSEYTAYQPAMSVVMTHEATVKRLHDLVPGGAIAPRQPPGNRKVQYTWRPTGVQAIYLTALNVQPYSVTKAQQLFYLIEICKRKMKHTRGVRVTDPVYLALCEELETMNRKGL